MKKFTHTQETKNKISKAARGKGKGGFNTKINCDICGQQMSPANLARHREPCIKVQGKLLNGKQLSVKEYKQLRIALRVKNWDVDEYLKKHSEQNNKCCICGDKPAKGRLDADHCHSTGQPRGLLCGRCNVGLGCFKDDRTILTSAIKYLKEQKE